MKKHQWNLDQISHIFHSRKCIWNCQEFGSHFVSVSMSKVIKKIMELNYFRCLVIYNSIHVPGWLLKWLNYRTQFDSNRPSLVMWQATRHLINPCCKLDKSHWKKQQNREHKICDLGLKSINISSSYFTIFMTDFLKKRLSSSCWTAEWQLSNIWPK